MVHLPPHKGREASLQDDADAPGRLASDDFAEAKLERKNFVNDQ